MSYPHAAGGSRPLAVLALSIAMLGTFAAPAGAASKDKKSATVEAAALSLGVEYGRQQMQRLAQNSDRDSLIAAALVGLSNDGKSAPAEGHADVVYRLVGEYSNDPLALYTAALICNVQTEACARGDDQVQLLRIAPNNAIHHLLLPNAGKPSTEQLHQAATAGSADSHFNALLGIVRTALADQAAPAGGDKAVDARELALALRRNELAQLPWPTFGPTMELCSPAAAREGSAELRADCSKLGLALFSDAGQSIVTRTYGGTLVRRFARGTPAETSAQAFRRQYLWLDELPGAKSTADKELMYEETATLGEWEALQRHGERSKRRRAPAADWVPNNPQALLLPEERSATSTQK